MQIRIKQGLDLPFVGEPDQQTNDGPSISKVAVLGTDYVGLKPAMQVQVGDRVRLGQALFTDKRYPAVSYTAPGAGEVVDIARGARRMLQSVVIRLEGDEEEEFTRHERERRARRSGARGRARQPVEVGALDGASHAPVQQGARPGHGARGTLRYGDRHRTAGRRPGRYRGCGNTGFQRRPRRAVAALRRSGLRMHGPRFHRGAARGRQVSTGRFRRPASGRSRRYPHPPSAPGRSAAHRLAPELSGCHRNRPAVHHR